jgi:Dolichyl-phosphate-mannose-protein mannosyltransferase
LRLKSRIKDTRVRSFILIFIFALALFLRVAGLGRNGFSDDEANKILATEAYRKGDFTPNAEHPMLMKVGGLAVLLFAEKWNAHFPSASISPEAAMRFPVALASAAISFAIYLLGRELFSPAAALIASLLWAVDINAVALGRIAKEDMLATLFFLLANYFFLRGKRFHSKDPSKAKRSYLATGTCFGLMFASKYLVPFPWITLFYYDIFRFRKEPRWRIDRKTRFQLYGCLIAVFLLVNPVVLFPQVWIYNWRQFTQQRMTHVGYVMMDQIFLNKAFYTLWGVPVYYYVLYLFVKTPIPLLICFATGLIYAIRRYKDDRFLFIAFYFCLWIFLLSLPGGKFTRYMAMLLPAVILLEALGLYLVYTALANHLKKRNLQSSGVVLFVLMMITAGWEIFLNARYYPLPSLYVSAQGGGEKRMGYYFPQDEFYDAGLRESVRYLSERAPKESVVLGTTPAAFEYYKMKFARPDLEFISLPTNQNAFSEEQNHYLIIQNYRQYFETSYILTFVYSQLNPLFISSVKGKPSVELYLVSRQSPFAKKPFWRIKNWPGLLRPLSQAAK